MKKLLGMLIFIAVMLLGSTAHAWKPSGWAYMQYPAVYSVDKSSWMYINPSDTQWYFDYYTAGWSVLGAGYTLDNGWVYFDWPFAYAFSNGHWHYMYEALPVWVYSFADAQWSVLGVPDQPDIQAYVDTIMGLLSGSSYSALTDQLGTILSAVIFGSSSTCPAVTVTPPLTDLSSVASPTVITVDYGAGCTPSGSTSVMSGSVVLTITNFTMTDTEVNADFSLALNNLTKDGTVLGNGTVSGNLHAVPNDSGGFSEASITLDFDTTLLDYTLSGEISLTATDVDLFGGSFGPITIAFDNFSMGAMQINSGTVVITPISESDTESVTQIEANLSTSEGPVDVTLLVTTTGADDEVIQVRTTETGTIGSYSIDINDVTWDSSVCSSYPSSGTITLTDGTKTINIGFTDACDGTYIYTES